MPRLNPIARNVMVGIRRARQALARMWSAHQELLRTNAVYREALAQGVAQVIRYLPTPQALGVALAVAVAVYAAATGHRASPQPHQDPEDGPWGDFC